MVAEPAGYFLLLAVEAEALLALLAACLLGGVVAGISWLLLAVLPVSSPPIFWSPYVVNLGGHLRRPLESEALRAG